MKEEKAEANYPSTLQDIGHITPLIRTGTKVSVADRSAFASFGCTTVVQSFSVMHCIDFIFLRR
jgi:hypothetical protein